jgi:hypothetical protein
MNRERDVFERREGLYKEMKFINLKSSLLGILVCKGRNFISHSTKLLAIFEVKIYDKNDRGIKKWNLLG